MSQWTPTAIANEPERERAHSSCSTIVVRRSAPLPPYFSSYSRPRKPSSPSRGQIDRGMRPAASHSSTCGMISRSMNCRTVARNISCCSEKIFTSVPLAFVGDLLGAVRNGPRRGDLHAAPQFHHVTDGRLELRSDRLGLRVGGQLHAEGQRVLMALASDDDLVPGDPRRARDDFVGLARVD